MQPLKISVVTVCFNAEKTIERCICSVLSQDYAPLEYILIDGGSTDLTMKIVGQYRPRIQLVVSEKDEGIYDAMNKGIALASGDVVGMLNADDTFQGEGVLSLIAEQFSLTGADVVYGDLDYLRQDRSVQRRWRSGDYAAGLFGKGWMPPHPTFYTRRLLFGRFGYYRLDYGTAADYELMLRFIHKERVSVTYLPEVLVGMQTGGASNGNFSTRLRSLLYDLKAMRSHGLKNPLWTALRKRMAKIKQFF